MVRLRAAPPRRRRGAERVHAASRHRQRHDRRQLRQALQVRHHGQLQPRPQPATRGARGRDRRSRLHSEVGREPHVRPRPQDPARAHPDRRHRGLLVPAARAQARGGIHGLAQAREAGAAARRGQGSRRPRRRTAKTNFAADYAQIVRLGKAIPAERRHAQPARAARRAPPGTGIRFTKIATGRARPRRRGPAPAPAHRAAGSGSERHHAPAAAGGQTAQSAPGGPPRAPTTPPRRSPGGDARHQSGVARRRPRPPRRAAASCRSAAAPATGDGRRGRPAGARDRAARARVRRQLLQPRGLLPRRQALRPRRQQNVVVSGRLVTIDGVSYAERPAALPADQGRRSRRPCTCRRRRRARPPARRRRVRLRPPGAPTPAATPAPAATPTPAPTATATP